MSLLGFDFTSLKYLAASFLATYCSGLTHPLDVIKTRLQSTSIPTQVTTAKLALTTSSPTTAQPEMPSDQYTAIRESEVSIKDSTSPSSAKPAQFLFSFGCTPSLTQLRSQKKNILSERTLKNGCSSFGQH